MPKGGVGTLQACDWSEKTVSIILNTLKVSTASCITFEQRELSRRPNSDVLLPKLLRLGAFSQIRPPCIPAVSCCIAMKTIYIEGDYIRHGKPCS